jgi:hypothetical protein
MHAAEAAAAGRGISYMKGVETKEELSRMALK